MRKKLFRKLLLAVMSAAMLCSAAAATELDMSYVGPLDDYTGTPSGAGNMNTDPDSVWITDTIRYNTVEKAYLYPTGNALANWVKSSVMDGMLTNEAVYIAPDSGVRITVFHNGEELTDPNQTEFSEPGEYVVMAESGNQQEESLFSFTIVGKYSNAVKSYRLPESFQIVDATLNGNPIYFDRAYVSLSEEGKYYIKTICSRTDREYELEYTADFTPPELVLEAVENGVAKGPVNISNLEEGSGIGVWLNGDPIPYSEELTTSGHYVVKVADEAGNMSTYTFTIQIYFDGNSIAFFAIIVGVIISTIAYVVLSRKRLRVR